MRFDVHRCRNGYVIKMLTVSQIPNPLSHMSIQAPPAYVPPTIDSEVLVDTFVCTDESDLVDTIRLALVTHKLLEALKGVIRVADRKTVEFDAAHAAIAKALGQ